LSSYIAVILNIHVIHFTNQSVNFTEETACSVSENNIKIRKYVNIWCILWT